MRYISILIGLALGWYAYIHYVKMPAEARAKEELTKEELAKLPPAPLPPDTPPPPVISEEDLAKVRSSTGDSDPKVRWQAAKFLLNARDPQAEGILARMLQMDEEAGNRKEALLAFAEKNDKRYTPYLVSALRDADPDVKLAALSALGRLGDPTTAPAISDALKDSEDRVRLAAIDTLNQLQNKHKEELARIEEERQRYQKELAEHQKKVQQVQQRN